MHRPVLLTEVLDLFSPKPGETYIDATADGGGHLLAIAEKIGPSGRILGIDRDCELIAQLGDKIGKLKIKNVKLVCDNFANIADIARRHHLAEIDGILFDLGFSSYHIEESGRGFSFLRNEALDMRYNPAESRETAAAILNSWPERKLADIISEYGEERFAKNIARAIVLERRKKKIERTAELVKIIRGAVPARYCRKRLNCATKTFQALRIVVNDELRALEQGLRGAINILSPGGALIVISFHSLEDRVVKKLLKEEEQKGRLTRLVKKIIKPSARERAANSRSRSAKLRAVQKLL